MPIEIPSVLAFDRKLENSDALMYAGKWEDRKEADQWQKIEISERRNRGVMGHQLSDELLDSPEDLQKEVEKPNPVWGDDATLPHECDTLRVSFSLRVLGHPYIPSTCNKHAYQEKLEQLGQGYDFSELAFRYALNIANGRFLWRNRVCAKSIEIHVKLEDQEELLVFHPYQHSLKDFNTTGNGADKLTAVINKGLSGDGFAFIEIDAFVRLGMKGQRVWPSQEMIMNIPKGEKSRHLFKLDGCAAIHSQKIGNALRTIDTWYGDHVLEPIAIEPYGSVTHRGQAYRTSRNDFYTLSKNWIVNEKELTEDEKHFVMAILIRGGVFGEKGE